VNGDTITGNIHTNHTFEYRGSKLNVEGAIVAVNKFDAQTEKIEAKSVIEQADPISMFNAGEVIKAVASIDADTFNKDKQFNNNKITIQKPLLVDGKLTFNGSAFLGNDYIVATDDITFNVSSLKSMSDKKILIYSEHGDITIRASTVDIDGIIYAPNGTVTINSSQFNLEGRIFADQIVMNGSTFHIAGKEDDLEFLNGSDAVGEYREKFETLLSEIHISEYSIKNFQSEIDTLISIYESGRAYESDSNFKDAFNSYYQAWEQLQELLKTHVLCT
jgi:hypothetical protein